MLPRILRGGNIDDRHSNMHDTTTHVHANVLTAHTFCIFVFVVVTHSQRDTQTRAYLLIADRLPFGRSIQAPA